ncbi:MAG TPA: hypothetical protein PKM88_08290 [bacterium]|nr:hypothetical protein [bacterium]
MLQRRWDRLLKDLQEQREFREAVHGAANYDALQAALRTRGHELDRAALAEFLQELHRQLAPPENDELSEAQLAGVAGGTITVLNFGIVSDAIKQIGSLLGQPFNLKVC